jgi:5'-nucleotidase
VHEAHIAGVPRALSINGPPALCIFLARLGVFGGVPDIVVSGINPGENVGRATYQSGTVGAAPTARNGGFSGVAVSQTVSDVAVEGQGGEEGLSDQRWDTAATVAAVVVEQVLARPPVDPVVVNLNVPNLPLEELKGWRETEVGLVPPRTIAEAHLVRREGHEGAYHVEWSLGDVNVLPSHVDGGAVTDGWVSISWLSRFVNDNPGSDHVDNALDGLLRR